MKKIYLTTLIALLFTASYGQTSLPFAPLDTNFRTQTVRVPSYPMDFDILCIATDCTAYDAYSNTWGKVKEWADFTSFAPINNSSDSGYVVINNEMIVRGNDNPTFGGGDNFGDGGGMTQFKVKKIDGRWKVVPQGTNNGKPIYYKNINFTPVGLTIANCGGWKTPWGTVLTAEEWGIPNNLSLWHGVNFQGGDGINDGIRDTSDYTVPPGHGVFSGATLKRFQNMNYIVEVNPVTAQVIKKHYAMGRFDHEQAYVMPDQKTVYLTDDATPAVFFKFVANTAGDLSSGILYAYKQNANGIGGTWIQINDPSHSPARQRDSLMNARAVALRAGATMGIRHEWMTYVNGKLYICETGNNNTGDNLYNPAKKFNGQLEYHLKQKFPNYATTAIQDLFGRVIEFDPVTNHMRSYLEGGPATNGNALIKGYHLSNPDGIDHVTINGKTWLVIQEDLNGSSHGRVPAYLGLSNCNTGGCFCELYFLDASIQNPTVNDLKLFMIGPRGVEITGAVFTPDGKTMFVNLQHPNTANVAPWNRSITVAVTGFNILMNDNTTDLTTSSEDNSSSFKIYPNPATRELHFNKVTDVAIYDNLGNRIRVEREVKEINISDLTPGVYFIQTIENEVQKLIVE
ncbi:MAG: DUF839 domain-containing protein [Cytophagaceae bacterium]|nr:DUF839 domain-containing protein [Cytophagaceae bacterium]MDW8455738.1 DUF839 domain-containing protein [Cytophagaceae bacterium]